MDIYDFMKVNATTYLPVVPLDVYQSAGYSSDPVVGANQVQVVLRNAGIQKIFVDLLLDGHFLFLLTGMHFTGCHSCVFCCVFHIYIETTDDQEILKIFIYSVGRGREAMIAARIIARWRIFSGKKVNDLILHEVVRFVDFKKKHFKNISHSEVGDIYTPLVVTKSSDSRWTSAVHIPKSIVYLMRTAAGQVCPRSVTCFTKSKFCAFHMFLDVDRPCIFSRFLPQVWVRYK